jgi:plastocyanin
MNVSTKRASIGIASTLVAAGLVVGGVISSSDAATTTTTTINISQMKYLPNNPKIKVGTKVKWVNKDSTVHTVTWDNGKSGLQSMSLGPHGSTKPVTVNKVGKFTYHCIYHPMHGAITVIK